MRVLSNLRSLATVIPTYVCPSASLPGGTATAAGRPTGPLGYATYRGNLGTLQWTRAITSGRRNERNAVREQFRGFQ